MIQIAVIAVSIGLVILGVKGFTKNGIPISRNFALSGTSGKIAGVICILLGLVFIPLFLLAFMAYGDLFSK